MSSGRILGKIWEGQNEYDTDDLIYLNEKSGEIGTGKALLLWL